MPVNHLGGVNDYYQEEVDQMARLVASEIIAPYQTQRLTKDGRLLNIWLTGTALINEAGKIYAIATTEREIVSP